MSTGDLLLLTGHNFSYQLFLCLRLFSDCVLSICLRYLLDLTKEQEVGFAEKVGDVAKEAGFEPSQEEKRDVYATFALQEE